MKHLFATYCSAHKTTAGGLLPAAQRYQSRRIQHLVDLASAAQQPAAILSGKFGLIPIDEPIPWYDHLLQEAQILDMTHQVQQTLQKWQVTEITWLTASPEVDPNLIRYQTVMVQACRLMGAALVVTEWPV